MDSCKTLYFGQYIRLMLLPPMYTPPIVPYKSITKSGRSQLIHKKFRKGGYSSNKWCRFYLFLVLSDEYCFCGYNRYIIYGIFIFQHGDIFPNNFIES